MIWINIPTLPIKEILEYLETEFILDPDSSSLDYLPDTDRYKNFKWHRYDYIGGPKGPNERRAKDMVTALTSVRPERRPHFGPDAILTKATYKNSLKRYILSQLQPVPDFPTGSGYVQPKGEKLNQFALADFLKMRAAALKDQVPIIIRDSYRSPEVAARNAARADNPNAVANFSAHILGLAMDVNLSYQIGKDSRKFKETTTKPMQNVIDMRESPVHKWLFLRAHLYGWYPFQQEPWHWEYNPPGFQHTFFSNLPSP